MSPFDQDKLQKILSNLISNGINSTKNRSFSVSASHRFKDLDHAITRVKDARIGISGNDLPNTFDRFYQVPHLYGMPINGSGIGLAIIKELVHLMDGTIEISSKLDIGTTVTICLPITNLSRKTSSYKHTKMNTSLYAYQEKERKFLVHLNELISNELNNSELNVSFVCKKLHISRTQLHRKIKALTNKSITAYIRGIRLYMAKSLILNSTLTVQQIAYDTGFNDPSYFHRVFVKEFGNSPGYFRNS